MTIGVDTDYFLPADREPKNYRKLPSEVLEMIEMARVQIADCDDVERIGDVVRNVNDVLREDKLLGLTATLESEATFVTSRGMEYCDDGMQEIDVRDMVAGDSLEGVFVGCDVATFNGITPELVYILELPMVTKGKSPSEALRTRTAVASVDTATIAVDGDVSGTGESLEVLSMLKSEFIDERVRYLDRLKEAADEVDADLLREMGIVATEILAQPEVATSKALQNAVTELFSGVLDGSTWYVFEGFEVNKSVLDGHIGFGIHNIDAAGYIDEVVTVEDFEYIPEDGDKAADAVFAKTLQPALLLRHNDDEYVVPMKYLKLFYIEKFSPINSRCQDSRSRFLEEYPDVFDPSKHRARRFIRNIIERYFKNDERGV